MVTLYFRFLTLHSKYAKWSLRPRRLLRNLFANERHKKTSMAFQTDTMKLKHCEVLHIWSPMFVVTRNSENSPSFWVFLDLFLDFIIRIFSFKMKRKKNWTEDSLSVLEELTVSYELTSNHFGGLEEEEKIPTDP